MQPAILSVLAGDVFRERMALRARLAVFKLFYYLHNALNLRRSLAEWKQRRKATHDTGIGTTAA